MKKSTSVFAASLVVVLSFSGCAGVEDSSGSVGQEVATAAPGDCTYTQGFWKNHASAWPVTSLTIGTVAYTQAQLLAILNQPVKGNGLISLSHQLIAAKLNLANSASSVAISGSIADADTMIAGLVIPPIGAGSLAPSSTSGLTTSLDQFNNGATGPGHCGSQPPPVRPPLTGPTCGNGELEPGEGCDDGNTTAGDNCSPTCMFEPLVPGPVCGNGVIEVGEECDDGNTASGDACSATCICEPPPPPPAPICGNGVLELGEQCDDGNLICFDGCSETCTFE